LEIPVDSNFYVRKTSTLNMERLAVKVICEMHCASLHLIFVIRLQSPIVLSATSRLVGGPAGLVVSSSASVLAGLEYDSRLGLTKTL